MSIVLGLAALFSSVTGPCPDATVQPADSPTPVCAAGTQLLGTGPVTVTVPGGELRSGRGVVEAWQGGHFRFAVFSMEGAVADGVTVRAEGPLWLTTRLVARVDPVQDPKGSAWEVTPSLVGRVTSQAALADAGWAQVVAEGVPDQPHLRDQYLCHPASQVARTKPSWNLESWRPDVGLAETMLARCNP